MSPCQVSFRATTCCWTHFSSPCESRCTTNRMAFYTTDSCFFGDARVVSIRLGLLLNNLQGRPARKCHMDLTFPVHSTYTAELIHFRWGTHTCTHTFKSCALHLLNLCSQTNHEKLKCAVLNTHRSAATIKPRRASVLVGTPPPSWITSVHTLL